jgi:DNA repair protein RadC
MAIHEWPVGERPREKMLERGPSALSDAELLAVIIGSGTQGRSAVDVGREVLKEFGSIREFLTADRKRCLSQLGIGPVRLLMLQAALELARRHHLDEIRRSPALSTPGSVGVYLLSRLRDLPYEVFCCLHLDNRHRFIAFEELFRGTLDGANVHAREVARQVMHHNSAAVIIAHNHPSGVAEPSEADLRITQRLRHSLGLINVRVLDHVVVGDGVCVSFAERGLL